MKVMLALGAVALLAAPAYAQQTQCRWVFGTWTCDTQPPTAPPSSTPFDASKALRAFQDGQRDRQQDEARDRLFLEQERALAMQAERQQLLSRVGKLVVAGQCREASDISLNSGDFDLSAAVDRACEVRKDAPAK